MRKLLCLLFCLMFLVSGCGDAEIKPVVSVPEQNVDMQATFNDYLKRLDNQEKHSRDFGQPETFIDMSERLVAGIIYPKIEEKFLNSAIKNRIDETVAFYKNEAEGMESEKAELILTYDCCVVSENMLSVKLSGTYNASYMANPVDVVITLNADTEKRKIIAIKDAVQDTKILKEKLVEKAEIKKSEADDKILDNFFMTKEGIEITLLRGEYFPSSEGTKSFLITYDELKTDEKKEKEPIVIGPVERVEPVVKLNPDGTKPKIALTFDDGPSAHTERLLDVFASCGGKGTFFIIGDQIEGRENVVRRIVNEGHGLGNHTWNHRKLTKLKKQEIIDELVMTKAKILEVTGVECNMVRPPYGSFNDEVKEICKELEMPIVNWSVDTLDWKTRHEDLIYNAVVEGAKNGAIILCHDLHETTVNAMADVIPKLVESGFELVTVPELLGELEPGKVHRKLK